MNIVNLRLYHYRRMYLELINIISRGMHEIRLYTYSYTVIDFTTDMRCALTVALCASLHVLN